MAEEITKYTVSVGFDTALTKLNNFEKKMNAFNDKQEKSLRVQISLQQHLNNLQGKGLGGTGIMQGILPYHVPTPSTPTPKPRQPKSPNDTAFKKKLESIKLSALWMDKLDSSGKAVQNSAFKEAINRAKTEEELRKIVASERSILRDQKRKEKSYKKQNFFLQRMKNSSNQIAGNMVSAFAVSAGIVGITKIGQDFERAENTLTAITSSTEKAAEEMQYLKDITYQMGIPLRETAKDYAKLTASAQGLISEGQTKQLFEDLTKAAVVLGTTSEDQGLVFKALTQMLSKQKVSAEEYRSQLGERMPIALQAMGKAAVAAGIVTQDMIKKFGSASGAVENLMQQGKLYSKDVIPYFGEEIAKIVDPGFAAAMKASTTAMGRFQNVVENMADTIFRSGYGEGLTEFFNTSAASIKDLTPLWESLGKIFGSVFKGLSLAIKFLTPALKTIGIVLNGVTDILGDFSAILLSLGLAVSVNNSDKFKKFFIGIAKAVSTPLRAVLLLISALNTLSTLAEEIDNYFRKGNAVSVSYDPRVDKDHKMYDKEFAQTNEGLYAANTSMFERFIDNISLDFNDAIVAHMFAPALATSLYPTMMENGFKFGESRRQSKIDNIKVTLQVGKEELASSITDTVSFKDSVSEAVNIY